MSRARTCAALALALACALAPAWAQDGLSAQGLLPGFSEAEHEPYLARGQTQLRGQARVRTADGVRWACAKGSVLMLPATPFFEDVLQRVRKRQAVAPIAKLPARHKALIKSVPCSSEGGFVFSDVPAGAWVVVAAVTDGVGSQAALVRRVQVPVSGGVEVAFAPPDWVP